PAREGPGRLPLPQGPPGEPGVARRGGDERRRRSFDVVLNGDADTLYASMRVVLVLLVLAGAGAWGMHAWWEKSIRVQTQFDALIQPAAERHGLDPRLVRAIIWRESRFQPTVRGLNKEKGLMQVTPG